MCTTERQEVRFESSAPEPPLGSDEVVTGLVGGRRSTGARPLPSAPAVGTAPSPTLSGTDAASELTRPTGANPARPKPARRRTRAQPATVAQASRPKRRG